MVGQAMIFRRMRSATSSLLVTALLFAPGSLSLAQEEEGDEAQAGTSRLLGRVSAPDGSALIGATIIAYHLSTEKVYRSGPTDGKGGFEITGLPYGYFDLAVETEEGLFVADQVVNVPPAGKASVTMNLMRGGTDESAPRGFLGAEDPPSGIAHVGTDKDKKGFWGRPLGIAVIAAGGVGLLLIATGGDDNKPASPSE